MSKRVANCRGRTTSRFGRVRYGFHVNKARRQLEELEDLEKEGILTEEQKEKFRKYKDRAMQIFPKALLRRHQGR